MSVQVTSDKNKGRYCLHCMLNLMGKLMWDTWYWCKYIYNEQVTNSSKKQFQAPPQPQTHTHKNQSDEMRKCVDFDNWTKWSKWHSICVQKYHKTKSEVSQCSAYRCCLLGHEPTQFYQWTPTHRRNMLSPSSQSRWHQH